MSVLEFDRPRATVIFRELVRHWQNREAPFNTERFIPPEQRYHPHGVSVGTREHALYLFFGAWLSRSGKTAQEVFSKAQSIAVDEPWIIDPRHPESLDRELFDRLESVIPFAGQEKYKVRVDWWFDDCMGRLRDDYDGDPRNIFLAPKYSGDWRDDRQAILDRLTAFAGTGPKIAQLTLVWFQEVRWRANQKEWQNIRNIPAIAVDIWLMRLVYQLGIVTDYQTETMTEISPIISDFICEVCYEEGIPHTDLLQALWHTGAVICGRMRPNDPHKGRAFCHSTCPVAKTCKGVVPANYVAADKIHLHPTSNGIKRTTTRLSWIRWSEIRLHPETFDDLWGDPV